MSVRIPLLAVCLTAWSGGLGAQEKIQESAYYPMRDGAQWTYRAGDQKVVLRLIKREKVNDVLCAVLETKRPDGLAITEHLGVQKDGLYRFKALNFALDPPLCVLKVPPMKGTTWKLNSRMGAEVILGTSTLDEAEVTVPHGKHRAIVVKTELQRGDQKFTITTYYARGFGMVKQTQTLGNKEIVLELEKFEEK